MTVISLYRMSKKVIRHPARELHRAWFRHRYGRGSVDVLCRGQDFILKLRSNSVLAEPLFVRGGFEDGEMRLLRRIVRPGWKILDVGANVGLYTVVLGNAVGPTGHVWSFEPFPGVALYLAHNIELNCLRNVTLVPTAVADTVGYADFHVYADGQDVYNSLGATERPVEKLHAVHRLRVPITTLDAYSEQAGIASVDLIKIDVEGAEERVIAGAQHLLSRSSMVSLLVELGSDSARQCGCSVARMIDLLRSWGFLMYRVEPSGQLVPHPASAQPPDGGNALFCRCAF